MNQEYSIYIPNIEDLKIEQRILLGTNRLNKLQNLSGKSNTVGRVISINENSAEIDVDGIGIVNATKYKTTDIGSIVLPLRGVNFLKTQDHQMVLEYMNRECNATSSFYSHPIICYANSVDQGVVSARIITAHGSSILTEQDAIIAVLDKKHPDSKQKLLTASGNAVVSNPMPLTTHSSFKDKSCDDIYQSIQSGDQLICDDYRLDYIDGKLSIKLFNATVFNNSTSIEAAIDFLNFEASGRKNYGWISTCENISYNYHAAIARTEPDKALVLIYNNKSRQDTYVMGSSGIQAYYNDELNDSLYDSGVGAGLWIIDNLKNKSEQSYEGEYDAWIEGDWGPANEKGITELFGPISSIDKEICDIQEINLEDGIHKKYIAMADIECFEIKFNMQNRAKAFGKFGISDTRWFHKPIIENPTSIDEFIDHNLSEINNENIKEVMSAALRDKMFRMPSLYSSAPSLSTTNTMSPMIFKPTPELIECANLVKKICLNNEDEIAERAGQAKNKFAQYKLEALLTLNLLQPDGMLTFSSAKETEGEWLFNSNTPEILELFTNKQHIVSLKKGNNGFELLSPSGLRILSDNDTDLPLRRGLSLEKIIIDADRATCEMYARELSGYSVLDTPDDGFHFNDNCITYTVDGVLHRPDGPAVSYLDRENEYWFRGNKELAADRKPNQKYFDALSIINDFSVPQENKLSETHLNPPSPL